MDSQEFANCRKKLNKTQKQMAQLLGTSIKAVHSYEQGWRTIPTHVERQVFYLISRAGGNISRRKACWTLKQCPPEIKRECPAWEFKLGTHCWFINGRFCDGVICSNWQEKMKKCRSCEIFTFLL